MPDWANDPADETHLRLYVPDEGWKRYADKLNDEDGKVEAFGAKRLVESAFLNALNATNLLVLTGSGSSLAAKNAAERPQPVGMGDLWAAVKAQVGDDAFDAICAMFPNAPVNENIEKRLTLCKLFLELNQTSDGPEWDGAAFASHARGSLRPTMTSALKRPPVAIASR